MNPTTPTNVIVSTKPKTGIKDFFMYAGFFVVLYTIVGTFINFIFSIINSTFPDRQFNYADPYGSGMRIAVSILIVLTPVLMLLLKAIYSELRATPEKKDLWPRRWGLYITFVLTIIALASDLITLIYKFLGGEISGRFIWKAVVILIIGGILWLFTHLELKNIMASSQKRTKISAWILIVAMIASIVTGLMFIGSPSFLRNVRDDNTREAHLSSLQSKVLNYHRSKGRLPGTLLEIVEGDPYATKIPVDPKTGAEYGYNIGAVKNINGTMHSTFNLCADFVEDGTADDRLQNSGKVVGQSGHSMSATRAMSYDESDYYGTYEGQKVINYDDHGQGQKCFEVTFDPMKYMPYKPAPTPDYYR